MIGNYLNIRGLVHNYILHMKQNFSGGYVQFDVRQQQLVLVFTVTSHIV